jgi:hypothetical protein
MAEISPKDQLALHEFSVRYRAGYAKEHPLSDLHLETIQDAIRGQYEQKQQPQLESQIEPPASSPEPEPDRPDIEP